MADRELLLEPLVPIKIHGRANNGRKILRFIGQQFPVRRSRRTANKTDASMADKELVLETLEPFKIQGRDKKGRKILRIIGKQFPAKELSSAGGEEALRRHLERKVFAELNSAGGSASPFVVVYVHTGVQRADNFPGVASLRSIYETMPAAVRDALGAVYFVHPGLQARLFFATFGRFLFSAGLYGKLRYISRLEFLWEHIRRGDLEIPEFVYDHDEELEHRPLMDYGIESDHRRGYDAPAMDTAASMYSLRCIS